MGGVFRLIICHFLRLANAASLWQVAVTQVCQKHQYLL
jgi:hypothetical protein